MRAHLSATTTGLRRRSPAASSTTPSTGTTSTYLHVHHHEHNNDDNHRAVRGRQPPTALPKSSQTSCFTRLWIALNVAGVKRPCLKLCFLKPGRPLGEGRPPGLLLRTHLRQSDEGCGTPRPGLFFGASVSFSAIETYPYRWSRGRLVAGLVAVQRFLYPAKLSVVTQPVA
jgi:hypothetical protein